MQNNRNTFFYFDFSNSGEEFGEEENFDEEEVEDEAEDDK